jgi:hypothetical protein
LGFIIYVSPIYSFLPILFGFHLPLHGCGRALFVLTIVSCYAEKSRHVSV